MKKYKICVYAICKNESKFIDRWYQSIKDADWIYVLDTGSEDDSVEKLKKYKNVTIKKCKINPWRFDLARNTSLNMVDKDADICICLDLDEVLLPGWREIIENNWQCDTTRMNYTYNWSLDENDLPIISFYSEKIHCRNGFHWVNPVHEILKYENSEERIITCDNLTVNHYPDSTKSRSSYLPLLELAVTEDPTNDRNMHYLGREYMFYQKWNECIDTLIKYLSLKTAVWKDERSASMRFIARSYKALNRNEEARMWLKKAIKETPYLREPFVELALLEFEEGNYNLSKKYCLKALKILLHKKTYINEPFCWDGTIYDILAVCYYNEHDYDNALKNINIALSYDKRSERLLNNKKLIEEKNKKV